MISKTVEKIINVLDVYEGRDAAITFTLYFCCLLSGLFPYKSKFHQSFQRIFKRLEDCRVVLRLYDDLTILRDFFTYELRPGVNDDVHFSFEPGFFVSRRKGTGSCAFWNAFITWLGWVIIRLNTSVGWEKWKWSRSTKSFGNSPRISSGPLHWERPLSGRRFFSECPDRHFLLTTCLGIFTFCCSTSPRAHRKTRKGRKSEWDERRFRKRWSAFERSNRKKPLIPWIAARNALLAMVRDGSEFVVAVHYLPEGYFWSSTLTYLQVGAFGTCSAFFRLFTLYKFSNP